MEKIESIIEVTLWRVYDEHSLDGIGFEQVSALEKALILLEQTGFLLNNSLYSNEYLMDYDDESKP